MKIMKTTREGCSIFQWYTASTAEGTDKTVISVAQSVYYSLTAEDIGKYIFFAVTPVASSGTTTGTSILSPASGPVGELNQVPTASNVSIDGNTQVGQTLTGQYTYGDFDGDPEGVSTYQWYRGLLANGSDKVVITDASNITYTVIGLDVGEYLFFPH
ncbi:MAG: hypothetical protein PHZ03_02515 [Syntrophomonas sp.]|nr:hypothetical protein [Syntrophomonas sp.]